MYMVDGVWDANLLNARIAGYPLTHEQVSDKKHIFKIDIGGGNSIVISTMKDIVSIKINTALEDGSDDMLMDWFGNSTGLVGSLSSRELLARDGVTVMEDSNAYGQEWQRRDRYVSYLYHVSYVFNVGTSIHVN